MFVLELEGRVGLCAADCVMCVSGHERTEEGVKDSWLSMPPLRVWYSFFGEAPL